LGNRYYWGSNGTVARLSMALHLANKLKPNPAYHEAQLAALDYLFGRNYYGRSFVTGLGHKPPMHPHDRRNGINGFPEPWPGNLVGGGWPTGRDWHDDQEDYRTNEIAINWNGALIYALAAVVEPTTIEPAE
jgi:endoglucanase